MVAVKPRERWYLFGNDVELADQLLRCDLAQAATVSERAWLLKHWPSLGGFDTAFDWLTQRDSLLLQDILGRATLLRIYQNRDDKNPWRAMVPPERISEFGIKV